MSWELFDRRRAPKTTEPRITIQKNGVISLNIAAAQALNNPTAVQLLYDRARRRVGFRRANARDTAAYEFRRQGKSNTFNVSGQRFARYYGIDIGHTRRYAAELDGEVLAIDLDNPIEEFR